MQVRGIIIGAAIALALPTTAAAQQGPLGPLNDLGALGMGEGQTPAKVTTQRNAEPPLVASPRAVCEPGAKQEPGIQGRVPAGTATGGLHCNVDLVSHQGTSGGFKVYRYTDETGRDCAFYDTALLFPLNAFKLSGDSMGVAVLDMSDPAKPVQTDTLTELPMLSPHESLNVNQKRGLIAAVLGNPATYPGLVSIYDASKDCRHPVLQSTTLSARLGHESGFSQDGNTFYATGTATTSVTAVDVTNPKAPHPVWQGNILSHGMSLNGDGTRGYLADATGGQVVVLDTSEIQARKANPVAKEIARLSWASASIPQNAIPFTRGGKPYLLETDEYTAATLGSGDSNQVGAARIIDISDETKPRVVGNIRLQVDQPADHAAASGDPGALSPVQGYAGHYCDVEQPVDPTVVACSFIASGLRVFDITELEKPKEIAYYVAPTQPRVENGLMASSFAMSKPAFVPARREVWYTDGATGFNALRVKESVWPKPITAAKAKAACSGRRAFTATLKLPKGAKVRSVKATLAGKALKTKRASRSVSARVDLRKATKSTVTLVIRAKLRSGRTVTTTRIYHPCSKRR